MTKTEVVPAMLPSKPTETKIESFLWLHFVANRPQTGEETDTVRRNMKAFWRVLKGEDVKKFDENVEINVQPGKYNQHAFSARLNPDGRKEANFTDSWPGQFYVDGDVLGVVVLIQQSSQDYQRTPECNADFMMQEFVKSVKDIDSFVNNSNYDTPQKSKESYLELPPIFPSHTASSAVDVWETVAAVMTNLLGIKDQNAIEVNSRFALYGEWQIPVTPTAPFQLTVPLKEHRVMDGIYLFPFERVGSTKNDEEQRASNKYKWECSAAFVRDQKLQERTFHTFLYGGPSASSDEGQYIHDSNNLRNFQISVAKVRYFDLWFKVHHSQAETLISERESALHQFGKTLSDAVIGFASETDINNVLTYAQRLAQSLFQWKTQHTAAAVTCSNLERFMPEAAFTPNWGSAGNPFRREYDLAEKLRYQFQQQVSFLTNTDEWLKTHRELRDFQVRVHQRRLSATLACFTTGFVFFTGILGILNEIDKFYDIGLLTRISGALFLGIAAGAITVYVQIGLERRGHLYKPRQGFGIAGWISIVAAVLTLAGLGYGLFTHPLRIRLTPPTLGALLSPNSKTTPRNATIPVASGKTPSRSENDPHTDSQGKPATATPNPPTTNSSTQ